ncbi:MAG TPA: hypothetical protein VEF76_12710 [Patescibacteria group bacterium]|nr:hypothetical protein [Patescibacteria group bacterium]
MANELDQPAKPKQASMLEGTVGKEAAGVVNLLYNVMTMQMCLGLTRSLGLGLTGPVNSLELAQIGLISPTVQGLKPALSAMNPNMLSAPKLPSPSKILG